MPEPDLIDATIRWQSALLDSASTDVIGVASWWDRATTALTTAAASATTYPQAVSTACKKLQIDTLSEPSARILSELEKVIGPRLAEWCETASRDAVYITAMTRVERTAKRATKTTTTKTTPEPTAPVQKQEPMF